MKYNLKNNIIARSIATWQSIICFLMFLFINIANAQDKMQFMPALSDVPVYKGIEIFDDSIFEFNSSWGSVIELEAVCDCSCKSVKQYYNKILPNVGWEEYPTEDDNDLYIRDGVDLNINLKNSEYGCEINFSETH